MNFITSSLIGIYLMQYWWLESHTTTHWFLNEQGKIQAQMDSIYHLRRPYDFLALLQQEERAKQVEDLKKQLIKQKAHIDKNEDKDTNLEEKIYRTYPDCVKAGKPLIELNLYASASYLDLNSIDGVNIDEYLDLNSPINLEATLEPDCDSASSLEFSLFALEHLSSIRLRENLTAPAEDDNFAQYHGKSPKVWGHHVARNLSKNHTSWALYTLAAQYWKFKGEALAAIECIRRAIYFSDREIRYIPLFYLGHILHRCHESEDAITVLHMALDHNKQSTVVHELLGTVYASVGFYNESLTCLDNALQVKPDDEQLIQLKHAVLCHAYLEASLEKQLQSLQRTLTELRAYQKKHTEWLGLQQKLLLEQATPEMKLESRLEYEEQKIRESVDGRGQDCFQYQQDGHTFLSCNMRRDQLESQGTSGELLLDLQSLLRTVESEAMRLGQQVLKKKSNLNKNSPDVAPLHFDSDKLNSGSNSLETPSMKDCDNYLPLSPKDSIPTVFLPTENKDIRVDALFEELQVYVVDSSPGCKNPSENIDLCDDLLMGREKTALQPTQPDIQGSHALTAYGLHLYDSETEVKLMSAVKKAKSQRWVFLNLAGLYWRIYGNLPNSLECIREAIVETPKHLLDVPLVNLGSLLYRAGRIEDALTIVQRALQINDGEAETHFLAGNLYQVSGNLTWAVKHYTQVLTISPSHAEARQFQTAITCHMAREREEAQLSLDGNIKDEEGTCSGQTKNSFAEGKCFSEAQNSVQKSENPDSEIQVRIGLETDGSLEIHVNDEDDTEIVIEDDPLPEILNTRQIIKVEPATPLPQHLCDTATHKLSNLKLFTSTWLSVSAKNIDVSKFLVAKVKEGVFEEPYCSPSFPVSLHTLDHLAGVKYRSHLSHFPETGLKEAFQSLAGKQSSDIDTMATRVALSLKQNETSWVLHTAAALYWRVVGDSSKAVDCLRIALHYAPRSMKDVALVSLANIFHRVDLLNNALVVSRMALEISPQFVVIHFIMANIYGSKGDFENAISFYQSTLALQPHFEPALERLRIMQCTLSSSVD